MTHSVHKERIAVNAANAWNTSKHSGKLVNQTGRNRTKEQKEQSGKKQNVNKYPTPVSARLVIQRRLNSHLSLFEAYLLCGVM